LSPENETHHDHVYAKIPCCGGGCGDCSFLKSVGVSVGGYPEMQTKKGNDGICGFGSNDGMTGNESGHGNKNATWSVNDWGTTKSEIGHQCMRQYSRKLTLKSSASHETWFYHALGKDCVN